MSLMPAQLVAPFRRAFLLAVDLALNMIDAAVAQSTMNEVQRCQILRKIERPCLVSFPSQTA